MHLKENDLITFWCFSSSPKSKSLHLLIIDVEMLNKIEQSVLEIKNHRHTLTLMLVLWVF